MKRTQVIKITPCKKKQLSSNHGKQYFNKLSKNELGHFLSFFNIEEQLKLTELDTNFKSTILSINEVNVKEAKNWFKYICALTKFKNDSKGFSPYLNVYLNINIINLSSKCFGINSENINKENILKKIIESNYRETKLDKLLIQINAQEDFNLYFSILNSLQKDILTNLKFDIDIPPTLDIGKQTTLEIIKKLFTLISFKNIKPFNSKNLKKLVEIQNYFISNNIKTIHKYIWSSKNTSIGNAMEFFSKNKNCLLGINNAQGVKLAEYNCDSLKYLNIKGYPLDDYNIQGDPKFKKIKFDYPSEEFNSILLDKINFTNLEQISGLIISKENIDLFIKKLNSMNCLKKIHRIKFGLTEEEEEDENLKESLFKDFFLGIKNKHSENLVSISTWWKKFKKGKDYEFILSNFPNVRKIQEDYDASGLYDVRLEIDKILSCNAENEFKENDLVAITKMVKNYIKQKKEGENSIKFDLYNSFDRMQQLINYWKSKNENEILDKINYINFIVSDGSSIGKNLGLKRINVFDLKNDNSTLINSMKEIDVINQVILDKSSSVEKINSLTEGNNNKIISIVIRKDDLTKNELDLIKQIKNLKYLILDEKIINENKMNEGGYQFYIISKKYFANTTEMFG